jgi:very-short-patch-repair endonuclease
MPCDECKKEIKVRKSLKSKFHFCSIECKHKSIKMKENISNVLKNSQKFQDSMANQNRTYEKGVHHSPNTEFKKGWNETDWGKEVIKNRFKKHYSMSHPEKILQMIITKYNLPFEFVGDGKIIIGSKLPDFIYKLDGRKIIEVFSDYWHREDVAKYWHQTEAGTKEYYKQQGFNVLVIWEKDIRLNNQKELVERINKFINESLEIIGIPQKTYDQFIEFSNGEFDGDYSKTLVYVWECFKHYQQIINTQDTKLDYMISLLKNQNQPKIEGTKLPKMLGQNIIQKGGVGI